MKKFRGRSFAASMPSSEGIRCFERRIGTASRAYVYIDDSSEMELCQVVYLSSAAVSFSERDLETLVARASDSNRCCGLTGMLLFHDGSFIQVLEGSAPAVDALLSKIARDYRHRGMIEILRHPIEEREFDAWSMGLITMTEIQYAEAESIALEARAGAPYAGQRAHQLLRGFARDVR